MRGADLRAAAGQRDVNGFFRQLRFQHALGDALALLMQRLLQRLLGDVDKRACRRFFSRRQTAQALEQIGQRTALAEIARLRLLERISVIDAGEQCGCFGYELVEILHRYEC